MPIAHVLLSSKKPKEKSHRTGTRGTGNKRWATKESHVRNTRGTQAGN